jgi:hypothetical protein
MTYRGNLKMKTKTKVLALSGTVPQQMFGVDKAFIGFAGNADDWGEVVAWFSDPSTKPPRCRGIEFLMLTDKKKMYHATNLKNWMEIPDKHFAIGSGMNFAIASMTLGKSPKEAVLVASKHDLGTGMGVLEYSFD